MATASRRRPTGVLTAVLGLVAGLLAVAVPAVADTALAGDVTGDGVSDRVWIRDADPGSRLECQLTLRRGLAGGGFAPAERSTLDVPYASEFDLPTCPGPTVVLTGPRPALNRLAVTSAGNQFGGLPVLVYRLTGARLPRTVSPETSFDGADTNSRYGTVDLDGDRYADWWRTGSDEGEGAALWTRRGTTYTELYRTGYNPGTDLQFFDLNRAGGTDVLVDTSSNSVNTPFAAVVDGKTGSVKTLVTGDPYGDPAVYDLDTSVVDLDHDAYPDLRVDTHADAPVAPRWFVNRSQGGRWSFVETTRGGLPL